MKNPRTFLFNMTLSLKILVLLVCMTALATAPMAQTRRSMKKAVANDVEIMSAPQASVTGIPFPGPGLGGNPDCATLNASLLPVFAHITTDTQLKLDFGTPNNTNPGFEFTTGNGRIVTPEDDEQPGKFIRVTSSGHILTSFNSDLLITAVIVKNGSDAMVYPYDPGTFSDTNLSGFVNPTMTNQNAVSHLTFCFTVSNNPSAAESSITGRVATAGGKAIAGARLTLVNPFTGEARTAATNAFGFYTFDALDSGAVYFISVNHRRYKFSENTKTVTLNDSLSNIDFTANQ